MNDSSGRQPAPHLTNPFTAGLLNPLQHPQILRVSLQRIGLAALGIKEVIALVGDGLGLFSRAAAGAFQHGGIIEFEQAATFWRQ